MPYRERPERLLTALTRVLRERGCSPETERAYRRFVVEYVRYHNLRHPDELGLAHIKQFIDHLAREQGKAPPTQQKAVNALLFMYRRVLKREVKGWHRALKEGVKPKAVTKLGGRSFFHRFIGKC